MSLSIYPEDLEEKIHSLRQGLLWRRSGLLTGEQMATIKSRTRTDSKQTNLFFRALFFIFILLALFAVTVLVALLADRRAAQEHRGNSKSSESFSKNNRNFILDLAGKPFKLEPIDLRA
jgi:hypothetical protein